MKTTQSAILVGVLFSISSLLAAADWPQFRGPNRDGKSAETGLMKSWPEGGPKKLWTADADLGAGYSSMSIVKGSIYTTGVFDGEGYIFALDLKGGQKWKKKYGGEWTKNFPAARTIPTFDDGLLYVMSGLGGLACFDTDGNLRWSVDTMKKYGSQNINWGLAESPLVVDDKVICTPGGTRATMVAFDKKSGKEIWKCSSGRDKAAYCSPVLIREGTKDLIVTITSGNIIGVNAKDGRLLWSSPYPAAGKKSKCGAHPNNPVYGNGQVYLTTGYNDGGVALALSANGSQARRVWANNDQDTHHGGVILLDGCLYGTSWNGNRDGNWVCLDWKTGSVKYDKKWENKGSLVYADGMLYCYAETGTLGLVKAASSGFNPVSQFQITEGSGKHWAHPAIADGVLYIRHGEKMMAFSIKK